MSSVEPTPSRLGTVTTPLVVSDGVGVLGLYVWAFDAVPTVEFLARPDGEV
jgi:hypothetical protein